MLQNPLRSSPLSRTTLASLALWGFNTHSEGRLQWLDLKLGHRARTSGARTCRIHVLKRNITQTSSQRVPNFRNGPEREQ